MFVLRAKVKIEDASERWLQFGLWGDGADSVLVRLGLAAGVEDLCVGRSETAFCVRIAAQHWLLLAPSSERAALEALAPLAGESEWMLEEIRAGRPLVTQATQDQFVPQMINFERIGAVDFQKGCYPGQEIVARAQYRGQVKRRMTRVRGARALRPGQELFSDDLPGQPSGTVVNVADDEALVVAPLSVFDEGIPLRAAPDAAALEVLPLPYVA